MAEEKDNLDEKKDLEGSENEKVNEEENKQEADVKDEAPDEIEDLKNSLLRLQADFSNYRKRVDKEKVDTINYANEDLISDLLPVIDDFNRAFVAAENQGTNLELIEGFTMINKNLLSILNSYGLEEIESDGQTFDPNFHQAILTEESEKESGIVLETLQKGYVLNEKVIRPSMVKVSE